jgi:endogenous inhibitor of DNA gyrase (YacG/DUF329 family)
MVDLHGWATESYRISGTPPSPADVDDGADTVAEMPGITRN